MTSFNIIVCRPKARQKIFQTLFLVLALALVFLHLVIHTMHFANYHGLCSTNHHHLLRTEGPPLLHLTSTVLSDKTSKLVKA